MAIKLSTTMRNAIIEELFNIPEGLSVLKVYSGTTPATATEAPTGTLLVTITSIDWADAADGSASLTGSYSGTAATAGIAGYARLESAGMGAYSTHFRLQGGIGTSATNDFVVNAGTLGTGGTLTLTQCNIVQPEA